MKTIIYLFLFALCLTTLKVQAVTVVVHPSNTDSLDKKRLKKLFLGKSKKFPNGNQAIPIDMAGGKVREEFLDKIVNKSEQQLKAYWSKLIFTGKGQAPKAVDNDAEVLKIVSANPNSIGYVADDAVNDSVKVVAKF